MRYPQGFGQGLPVDYWARYLSRSSNEDCDDQRLLEAIRTFEAATSNELVGLSLKKGIGARVQAFSSRLSTDKVIELLDRQIQRVRARDDTWPYNGSPEGLRETCWVLERRIGGRDVSWEKLLEVVDRSLRASVREYNLRLAGWISVWLASIKSPIGKELLTLPKSGILRENLCKELVAAIKRSPDAFSKALDGAERQLLMGLCYGFEEKGPIDGKPPFPEWHEFARELENAARAYPQQILSQLADLFTANRFGPLMVDADAANQLFPNTDILSVFAEHPEVTSRDPYSQDSLDALRAFALARKSSNADGKKDE